MHVPVKRVAPGQDGVASESCAVRVSGQVVRQAGQLLVMTLPAKLADLMEMMELTELAGLE